MLQRTMSKKSKTTQRLGLRKFMNARQLFRAACWVVIASIRMRPVLSNGEGRWVQRLYVEHGPPFNLSQLITLLQAGGVSMLEHEAHAILSEARHVEGSVIPFCVIFQLFSREKRNYLKQKKRSDVEDGGQGQSPQMVLATYGLDVSSLTSQANDRLEWWAKPDDGEWWRERTCWELNAPKVQSNIVPTYEHTVRHTSISIQSNIVDRKQEPISSPFIHADPPLRKLRELSRGYEESHCSEESLFAVERSPKSVDVVKVAKPATATVTLRQMKPVKLVKRMTTAFDADAFLSRMDTDTKGRKATSESREVSSTSNAFYIPFTHTGLCFNDPPRALKSSKSFKKQVQEVFPKLHKNPFELETRIKVSELERRPQRVVTSAGSRRPTPSADTVDSLHRQSFLIDKRPREAASRISRPSSANRIEPQSQEHALISRWFLGGEYLRNM